MIFWRMRVAGTGSGQAPELTPDEEELRRRFDARRAAGRARRWMRHNRCAYLWTFTFRTAIYDYGELALAVDRFLRRLAETSSQNARVAGKVVFLLIGEPHPGGHGWHAHGATNVYVPHKLVAELWKEGFVFVTKPPSGRRGWSPRKLSSYLVKYLAKQIGEAELHGCSPRPAGAHRYWLTQGHTPEALSSSHASPEAALAYLRRLYGQEDRAVDFGQDEGMVVPGVWLEYSDAAVARWVQRVKADSPP